jgi:hypothetical protein
MDKINNFHEASYLSKSRLLLLLATSITSLNKRKLERKVDIPFNHIVLSSLCFRRIKTIYLDFLRANYCPDFK